MTQHPLLRVHYRPIYLPAHTSSEVCLTVKTSSMGTYPFEMGLLGKDLISILGLVDDFITTLTPGYPSSSARQLISRGAPNANV